MFILESLFFIGIGYAIAKPSIIKKCFASIVKYVGDSSSEEDTIHPQQVDPNYDQSI